MVTCTLPAPAARRCAVTAHKTIRAETDADLQQAKAEVKLEIEEKPGSVSVYYGAPWRCNGEGGGCHGEHRHFYNVTYDIDVAVPVCRQNRRLDGE
jgi:hypothetical protein